MRTYHTFLEGSGISFVNTQSFGAVSVNAGVNLSGTGRTFWK